MWLVHELKRKAISLQQVGRININTNIEPILQNIENLVNDLREYNYFNQCKSHVICKYWRADCCMHGNRCRFKHLKINKSPLECPYGRKCRRMINGKCNCANNIRNKINHPASQPYCRISNGNNNINNFNFNNNLNTSFYNNGTKNSATVKTADIKKNVSKNDRNLTTRLKLVNNIKNGSGDNKTLDSNKNNNINKQNITINGNNFNTRFSVSRLSNPSTTMISENLGDGILIKQTDKSSKNKMCSSLHNKNNNNKNNNKNNNNNNNKNKNDNSKLPLPRSSIPTTKNGLGISGDGILERGKQKRKQVLPIRNNNVLRSSLHKNNNNNNNNINNNNNMDGMRDESTRASILPLTKDENNDVSGARSVLFHSKTADKASDGFIKHKKQKKRFEKYDETNSDETDSNTDSTIFKSGGAICDISSCSPTPDHIRALFEANDD